MRHKHADIIHAWAEGAEIERFRPNNGGWVIDEYPSFSVECKYRIKPEKKPDFVRYAIAKDTFVEMCPANCNCGQATIKLTFDGETLKLKDVEMIEGAE